MVGGEIIRIRNIPDSPDADIGFDSFNGQRIAYFDTTTEAHAIDQPLYKVEMHPPGTKFTPNGLPLVRLVLSKRRWRTRVTARIRWCTSRPRPTAII